MIRLTLVGQKLIALFLLGVFLLTFPVLGLFVAGTEEEGGMVAGIPALFLWIYGVWSLLIALAAWFIHFGPRQWRRSE